MDLISQLYLMRGSLKQEGKHDPYLVRIPVSLTKDVEAPYHMGKYYPPGFTVRDRMAEISGVCAAFIDPAVTVLRMEQI